MSLHSNPTLLIAATYAFAALVVLATDRYALPPKVRAKYAEQRAPKRLFFEFSSRIAIITLIYAGFLSIYWRPIYASHGTISFFIIFTGISRAKFIYIREPLVFSDIALVTDLFKHKEIFYATFINIGFWMISIGYIFGVTLAYIILEPPIIPSENRLIWITFGLLFSYSPWFLMFTSTVNRPLVYMSGKLLQTMDPRRNTARLGAFASIIYHFILWLGRRREKVVAEIKLGLQNIFYELAGYQDEREDNAPPLLVVWQSESFIDLRHFGVADLQLPSLDRLRKRATQWGRMTNVFEGGYTLRTEFAVLTGLQPDDVHADASYPYLRASHYSEIAWPRRFLDSGWTTHFIHPYDRTFFFRDKAIPLLGFQEMTMLDAFVHDSRIDGPYVSDRRLTNMVIDINKKNDPTQAAFLFIASMANHGPWEPGRVGSLTDSVEIYKELLRKADDALGHLVAHLDGLQRPVWFVFYGDHAPLLKAFADPFPDPRTDYVIVPLGTAKCAVPRPVAPKEAAPWNLIKSVISFASYKQEVDE